VFIGAGRVQMVAPLVYQQIGLVFNWPFGAAIAFIILAVSVIGIVAHDQIVRERPA
jgi:putative spermidine/putrescine transport system permease protein